MRRDDFEERYGSLRDEGLTPEECGLKPRKATEDEEPDPTQFFVMSPDGLPISPNGFKTREDAQRGLHAWCQRFMFQGYYAAVAERISLSELPGRCRIVVDESGQACPYCGAVQDCRDDCPQPEDRRDYFIGTGGEDDDA